MKHEKQLALVTGASSGIGAELARQLAARGADLILTARRRDRMESLASELQQQAAIKTTVIESDLNTADGADRLVAQLAERNLEPTTLINNAGFGYYGPFIEQADADFEAMLQGDKIGRAHG